MRVGRAAALLLGVGLVGSAGADAGPMYLRQLQEDSECAADINMDGLVSTEDLLVLLARFGRTTTGCDAGCQGEPAAGCDTCLDDLSACNGEVASGTTSLDTCTDDLAIRTAEFAAAMVDMAAASAQHQQTTATLQIALQAEHNATVAALQQGCDSALDTSLATAQAACLETAAALQAELEAEHATTISTMEQDCSTQIAAGTSELDTCTGTLATRTTELETAETNFAALATECAESRAALESELQAEHAATTAALEATLYVNCNNTLIDRLAEAQEACVAARTTLEAQLETEHATTLSLLEIDCNAEAQAAAASHAEIVTGLQAQLAALEAQKEQELAALAAEYEQRLAVLHCPTPIVPFADVSGDTNYGGAGVTISCHAGYLPAGNPTSFRIAHGASRDPTINLTRCAACRVRRRKPIRVYARWDVESSSAYVHCEQSMRGG